jgi:tRNA threonylcarbamoyladenosine modification (KEOPS) complex  Pcc1 subunit
MKADSVVRLSFPSESHMEIIFKALEPETRMSPKMRSRVTLKKKNAFLILKFEARDTIALRAAVNAYLRWISSLVNVLETLETVF